MLRIVDPLVHFLCSVILAASALAMLLVAPPAGIVMLLLLRRHLHRQASRHMRPRPQIRLS